MILTKREFDTIEGSLYASIMSYRDMNKTESSPLVIAINNDAIAELQDALDSIMQLRNETYSR